MFYTDDLAVFLMLQLQPDEHIRWCGRPALRFCSLFIDGVRSTWFPFWVVSVVSVLACRLPLRHVFGEEIWKLCGLLLVCGLLACSFLLACKMVGVLYRLKGTLYAVTNCRVMVLEVTKTETRLTSFDPRVLGEFSFHERVDGSGSIYFAERKRYIWRQFFLRVCCCFRDIPQVWYVADLFQELQREQALSLAQSLPVHVTRCGYASSKQCSTLREEFFSVEEIEMFLVEVVHQENLQALPDVERLLNHDQARVRMSALVVLTLDWKREEHVKTALLFLQDVSSECRETAAEVLGVMKRHTQDGLTLDALAHIVANQHEQNTVRASAYESMLAILSESHKRGEESLSGQWPDEFILSKMEDFLQAEGVLDLEACID